MAPCRASKSSGSGISASIDTKYVSEIQQIKSAYVIWASVNDAGVKHEIGLPTNCTDETIMTKIEKISTE